MRFLWDAEAADDPIVLVPPSLVDDKVDVDVVARVVRGHAGLLDLRVLEPSAVKYIEGLFLGLHGVVRCLVGLDHQSAVNVMVARYRDDAGVRLERTLDEVADNGIPRRRKCRDHFFLDAVVAIPGLLVSIILAAQLDFVMELVEMGLDSHDSSVTFKCRRFRPAKEKAVHRPPSITKPAGHTRKWAGEQNPKHAYVGLACAAFKLASLS